MIREISRGSRLTFCSLVRTIAPSRVVTMWAFVVGVDGQPSQSNQHYSPTIGQSHTSCTREHDLYPSRQPYLIRNCRLGCRPRHRSYPFDALVTIETSTGSEDVVDDPEMLTGVRIISNKPAGAPYTALPVQMARRWGRWSTPR